MREVVENIIGVVSNDSKLLTELGINESVMKQILDEFNNPKVIRDRWVNQFTDMTFGEFLTIIEDDITNN